MGNEPLTLGGAFSSSVVCVLHVDDEKTIILIDNFGTKVYAFH
jgi:hypothetical protein